MRLTSSILLLICTFNSLQANDLGDDEASNYRIDANEARYFLPKSEKDIEELKKFAEKGNINAQLSLACAYHFREKNLPEAVKWYLKAAEQGSLQAQWNLGLCYDEGEGVQIDKLEAIKWYRKVYFSQVIAKNKDLEGYNEGLKKLARNKLCELYLNDEKFTNYKEAILLLREAADQGSGDALNNLGRCYYNGWGVNKDLVEAFAYFNLSNTNKTYYSVPDYYALLQTVLTSSQIKSGEIRSEELRKEIGMKKSGKERKWWQFWK
jgi:TPR repeat protein